MDLGIVPVKVLVRFVTEEASANELHGQWRSRLSRNGNHRGENRFGSLAKPKSCSERSFCAPTGIPLGRPCSVQLVGSSWSRQL